MMQEQQDQGQDQENPLGSEAPAEGPTDPHAEMLDQGHRMAASQWKVAKGALRMAEATRRELESLLDLGPSVSSEDVLEGMAKLVAQGADPKVFTSMIAGGAAGSPPMPDSGEALSQWLLAQEEMLQQKEAALRPAVAQIGLQAAGAALHVLVNHHVRGGAKPRAEPSAPPPTPAEGPNPLT